MQLNRLTHCAGRCSGQASGLAGWPLELVYDGAMRVTFYGVRGSIATPGRATVRYGGNTVCVEVLTRDGNLIILDAGTGIRELGNHLVKSPLPESIPVFITHNHWDHIIGAPFFAPMWRKDAHIVLHALSDGAHSRLHNRVLFDGEHFPVRASDIPARVEISKLEGESVRIGSARVSRVALNHPGEADGFRIDDDDGASLCYLTDNELNPPGQARTTMTDLARFAAGTTLLIHDAQYLKNDMPLKRGWGHSVVDDVLELGRLAEARTLALHHHDPERDDEALDGVANYAERYSREHAPNMRCLVASEGLTLDLKP
jgi:phosphoribosyl 1,2-cyclic phosphodiesterase